ncbi:MAG: hypothetical protein WD738_01840 [Pirellulales bacterium]
MMNWLAENALPIWMGGAVALTMAMVIYLQTRSNRALLGMGAVVLATAALLTAEWFMETPREAVERTLYQLAAAVEANDVPGTLAFLAPTADERIREDVETLMPLVNIERARVIGTPQIDVADGSDPAAATVQCRGIIVATVKRSGMKGGADDRLTMEFVRDGDRWLVESYTSNRNWNRAVGRP